MTISKFDKIKEVFKGKKIVSKFEVDPVLEHYKKYKQDISREKLLNPSFLEDVL